MRDPFSLPQGIILFDMIFTTWLTGLIRYGHNMVLVEREDEEGIKISVLIVFGGMDEEGNYLGDLLAFDPRKRTWIAVHALEKV